jgi:TonB family protein
MNTLTLVSLALNLATPSPMPSDTPPPLPVAADRLADLKTREDVVAVTLLEDGTPAPSALVLPELLNRRQTLEYMRVHYPQSMLDVLTTTLPVAWVHVNADGRVGGATLVIGSGHAELDSLSLAVLEVADFKPAHHKGQPVGVWVPFPARIPGHAELLEFIASLDRQPWDAPFQRQFTQRPVLLNRTQVENAIIRFSHNLNSQQAQVSEMFRRSQYIGGKADMWIYIDERGSVMNALVKKTSGNEELDGMAIQVARLMRFAPARDGEVPVDVWIEVPIQFRSQ